MIIRAASNYPISRMSARALLEWQASKMPRQQTITPFQLGLSLASNAAAVRVGNPFVNDGNKGCCIIMRWTTTAVTNLGAFLQASPDGGVTWVTLNFGSKVFSAVAAGSGYYLYYPGVPDDATPGANRVTMNNAVHGNLLRLCITNSAALAVTYEASLNLIP